jgi:hypothetical protein
MNRLALFFGAIAIVFAALFVADLQGYFNITEKPVAVMRSSGGTVRRLALNHLTWDRAQPGTMFGMGDTISTGEDSRAKVAFYAGGEVDLEAGAMVVLGGDVEELHLNFVSGTGRVRIARASHSRITVARGAPKPKARAAAVVARAPVPVPAPLRTTVALPEPAKTEAPPPVVVAEASPSPEPVAAVPPVPAAPVAEAQPEADQRVEVAVVDDLPAIPPPPPSIPEEPVAPPPPVAKKEVPPPPREQAPAIAAVASAAPAASEPVAAASAAPPAPAVAVVNTPPVETPPSFIPAIQEKDLRTPSAGLAVVAKGELLTVAELPPVPEVTAPANDAVFDLSEGRVPKLEWQVPGEKRKFSYEIVLRPAEGDGPEKVLKSRVPALPLNQVAAGKFLWSVRAVTASGQRGPASESRWIEVKVPAQIPKPVLMPVEVETE